MYIYEVRQDVIPLNFSTRFIYWDYPLSCS